MAYKFYIPVTAFNIGGFFDGEDQSKVTVLIGCANDTHQQMAVLGKRTGPGHSDNNYTLEIRSSPSIMEGNLWNSLTNKGVKVQMAELVRKGCIVIDDGITDLTPAQILA